MDKTTVLGVLLSHRVNSAPKFQEIITNHGCNIKTRIGLHKVSDNKCSISGVILLETIGDEKEIESLENDIRTLPDVQVQKMVFEHQ